MKTEWHVVLRINAARNYGRGLLSGIGSYVRLRGNWQFYRQPPRYIKTLHSHQEAARIRNWHPDGAILWDSEGIEELLSLEIPLVVSPNLVSKRLQPRLASFPHITSNCTAIGEMAANYLLDKGFQHFAFCGFGKAPWSLNRQAAFEQRIAHAGHSVSIFQSHEIREPTSWQQEIDQIAEWIGGLPKPLAVMACNDDRGLDILEACRRAGCMIPEDVAVLGVDNEEESCEVFNPPLSSIHLNAVTAGNRAARVLDAMMNGEVVAPDDYRITVEPMYVVTRRSTDVMAIEDRAVAEAVNFILQHVFKPIQVEDVVRKIALSRRNLEQRFQKSLGRSVFEHIRKTKVTRISEMLARTQMSVHEIAQSFGYPDAHNISRLFQKETGVGLLAYRRKYQL